MRDDSEPTSGRSFPGYDGMDPAILRRYLAGQSDSAERRRVEAWASESADRRRYLAAMRDLYERQPQGSAEATRLAWLKVAEQMEPPSRAIGQEPPYEAPWEAPAVRVDVSRRQPRVLLGAFAWRSRWPAAIGVAAALLLAVGGGALYLGVGSLLPVSAPAATTREIATAKGQRAEIRLGDGSRVILGVESRLRFPAEFGEKSRDLYLEGTALFDVVHDESRPFLVRTANAVTEDLGTRFVITAYPESQATQVVVAEGSVALEPSRTTRTSRVVLTPGRLGRLGKADSVAAVRTVDPSLYTAWTRGELVFRNTPLSEVVAELRRWYDADVRLGDPGLANLPLTASFAVESLQEAMTVVTTVAPVRAVRQGRTVTLHRR
jgi:transmembrane sensor